jgi:beta-aspartyl-peptidase (threonine type)
MATTFSRWVLTFLLMCLCACETLAGGPEEVKAIRAVIDAQVGAWNEGNLDAFMQAYRKDENITGISDGAAVKGWKALDEQYRIAYRSAGKEMGKLVLSGVSVDLISPDAAFVRGKWELTTSRGVAKGWFTQVFKKSPEGWKIVHDHSSK